MEEENKIAPGDLVFTWNDKNILLIEVWLKDQVFIMEYLAPDFMDSRRSWACAYPEGDHKTLASGVWTWKERCSRAK